jgi:tripartite-type tricarboxylate transporter receptor subunit TctC
MVVNPSVPAKTVPEFITHAKANPEKIIMASVGNGTTPQMTGEVPVTTAAFWSWACARGQQWVQRGS